MRNTSEQERIPASYVFDLFFYHSTFASMVGCMTNSPGDLNGKIAHLITNLNLPLRIILYEMLIKQFFIIIATVSQSAVFRKGRN